jgi:hypothetical protein
VSRDGEAAEFIMDRRSMLLVWLMAVVAICSWGMVKPVTASAATVASESARHDYYVATTGSDSGPGSESRPWRTVNHAAAQAKPGDVIHVAPGTYDENVVIRTGGTAGAPIRFVSTVKWGAKVVGVRNSWTQGGDRPAIEINASYIDINGFDVSAPHAVVGIEVNAVRSPVSYVRLLDNDIHDVAGSCKLGFCDRTRVKRVATGGAGIILDGAKGPWSHNLDVIGNTIHDIGDPSNPYNVNLNHGIYVANGGKLAYTDAGLYAAKVQNNIIYRIEATGIHEYHWTSNVIVTNNTVTDAGVGGILVSGQPGEGANKCINRHSIVANNILVHNGWHTKCLMPNLSQCVTQRTGGSCAAIDSPLSADATFVNNLTFDNRCGNATDDRLYIAGKNPTVSGNLIHANPKFVDYHPGGGGDYRLAPGSPALGRGDARYASGMNFAGAATAAHGAANIGAPGYAE